MLYRDDTRIHSRQSKSSGTVFEKPEHCDEFKACLVQALKILEERYEV
jgi:hypothetical protein